MLLGNPVLFAPTSYIILLSFVKGEDKRVFEVGHVLLGSIHIGLGIASALLNGWKILEIAIPNILQNIIRFVQTTYPNIEAMKVESLIG